MQAASALNEASAWKGSDYKDDASWIYTLTHAEVDELESAARRCLERGLQATQIRREDFALETLATRLAGWASEINHGRGFLLVRGLPRDRLSDAALRAIFWGTGLYFGTPVSQNSYGDMLGDVYDEGVKMGERVRGYRTNQRLMFHTDRCDIVGLLCVRQAKSGGLSSIVSSTRIYHEIARNHPEFLKPLMDGYIHVTVEEAGAISTRRIPVYSIHQNVVSCRILRNTIETARRLGHAKYDALETAALEYMDTLANDEGMRLDMMLERGDMQFINNYTTLHARTAFEDFPEPDRRRHMVRLWLRSFGSPRPTNSALFSDYEGVTKALERSEAAARA